MLEEKIQDDFDHFFYMKVLATLCITSVSANVTEQFDCLIDSMR